MSPRVSGVFWSQSGHFGLSLRTMRNPLPQLVVLLVCTTPARNVIADPPAAEVEQAARALAGGDHRRAISLLSPPPLGGPATCILAEALLLTSQHQRAMLYLDRCHHYKSAANVRRTIAKLKTGLREKALAPISLSLSPASATASVDVGYSEEDIFLNNEDLWLPQGSYQIQLSAEGYQDAAFALVVDSRDRMLVPLSLHKKTPIATTEIDLGEDAGAELGSVATTADLRPKKFKTLLADRYRRAPDPRVIAEPGEHTDANSPWPLLTTAGGLALVSAGVAFHVHDKSSSALLSYGAGASLLAVATYLALRKGDGAPNQRSTASFSMSPQALSCAVRGSW